MLGIKFLNTSLNFYKGYKVKIVSNFKDYYDYLTNYYGVDNHIVYNRNNKLVQVQADNNIYNTNSWLDSYGLFIDVEKFLNPTEQTLYKSIIEKKLFLYFCGEFFLVKKTLYKLKNGTEKINVELSKLTVFNETLEQYFKDNNIVSALIYGNDYTHFYIKNKYKIRSHFKVEINPKLIEFLGNEFSAEEVFQNIETFIGKLNTQKPLLEVNNDQKIVKYGFDLKSSFRNTK